MRPRLVLDRLFSSQSHRKSYVERVRLLDYWKLHDANLAGEFQRSQFLLMIDKKPLIEGKNNSEMKLMAHSHADLKRKLGDYGLTFEVANSCLLEAVPSGSDDLIPLFGTSVRTVEPPEDSPVKREDVMKMLAGTLGGRFVDMRMAMLTLNEERQRNLLATFQSLIRWSDIYRRCPKCTTTLKMRVSKSAAECHACNKVYYPTFSPVAITLIVDPRNEFALLVRHKGSANSVYTAVAGFACSGESITDTAKREIAEELGIEVQRVRCVGKSQSWPIPDSSLMMAHVAVCDMEQKIDVCFDELETAQWFSREQVAQALRTTEQDPFLRNIPRDVAKRQELTYIPPRGAIAHWLIKSWVEKTLPTI